MNDNHERIRAILREHGRLSQDPSALGDNAGAAPLTAVLLVGEG